MKKIFTLVISFFLFFTLFSCAANIEYSVNDFQKPGKLVKAVYDKSGEPIAVKNGKFFAKRKQFVLRYEKLDKEKVNFDYFNAYTKNSTLELNITNFSYPGEFIFKYLVKKTTNSKYSLIYTGSKKAVKSTVVLTDEYDHALVFGEVYTKDGKTLIFQTYPEIITFKKENTKIFKIADLNEAQVNHLKQAAEQKNIPAKIFAKNLDLVYFTKLPKTNNFELTDFLSTVSYLNLSTADFGTLSNYQQFTFIDNFINLKTLVAPRNIDSTELKKILNKNSNIKKLVLKNNLKITDFQFLKSLNLTSLELEYTDKEPANLSLNELKNIQINSLSISGNFDLSTLVLSQTISELKLKKVHLNTLSNISKLTNLSTLVMREISGLNNDNFALLGNLTQLKYLEITHTEELVSAEFLNKLNHLSELNFSYSKNFKNFNFKNNLSQTNLKKLTLTNTSFDSLSEYTYFSRLTYFNAENTTFKKENSEIFDAKEITYFDGKNYIIDHIDHIHAEKFSELSKEKQDNFFKKTNKKFFGKGQIIGFDKTGYFVKVKILNKSNEIVEQIYYFSGFPDFDFEYPDWRVDEFEPSKEVQARVLQELSLRKTKAKPELKAQILKIVENSALSFSEKVREINLL